MQIITWKPEEIAEPFISKVGVYCLFLEKLKSSTGGEGELAFEEEEGKQEEAKEVV